MKIALIVSIVMHAVLLGFSFVGIENMFAKKMKEPSYAVFDFVAIGKKSKAPIISQDEAMVSKSKSQKIEKESLKSSKMQNVESAPNHKIEEEKKDIPLKKKTKPNPQKKKEISQKTKNTKLEKNKSSKNFGKKQSSSEKAVVNLDKKKSQALKIERDVAKKSFNSAVDSCLAKEDHENFGVKAEEVGDVLTATQIDIIKQRMKKCWHFPAGLKNAADLVVDIRIEFDQQGNVVSAKILDEKRLKTDADFRTAAESAYRAIFDPIFTPLPLPKENYDEWKILELSFDPQDMLS